MVELVREELEKAFDPFGTAAERLVEAPGVAAFRPGRDDSVNPRSDASWRVPSPSHARPETGGIEAVGEQPPQELSAGWGVVVLSGREGECHRSASIRGNQMNPGAPLPRAIARWTASRHARLRPPVHPRYDPVPRATPRCGEGLPPAPVFGHKQNGVQHVQAEELSRSRVAPGNNAQSAENRSSEMVILQSVTSTD